jgi:putative ABC transport system permease protein
MLALKNITKDYRIGDTVVQALKGVSMGFRANEFVSILGPSGCGKTTLLNIIGGLDRYTTGDLCIGGKSTTRFRDHEWDTYRNHSIGFVFQSYNLIPHQTVLTNVELALTISGVSKAERRRRAVQALERVGLGDQLDKKPTQMSGGQMQRVAIARAIVNDPEILLADEPTGALDTATSLQIMEILREIASDRLVIMVTHNPELAEAYSTRIVRLQDGVLLSDSDPFEVEKAEKPAKEKAAKKKKPLSLKTALSLSLNNLMTKKGRTFLTSFAGSIGIIGIALILSLSAGINAFIDDVQEDALSSYPITLQQETTDFSSMFSAMVDAENSANRPVQDGIIYVDDSLVNMMSSMMSTTKNDLAAFKKHLEANRDKLGDALSDVRYTYNFNMQIYSSDGNTRVNPTTIVDNMGESVSGMIDMMSSANSLYASTYTSTMNMFREMMDNTELLQSQYDVIAGEWAYNSNEVMLVVNENNTVTNLMLYVLGLMDQSELSELVNNVLAGNKIDVEYPTYTYEDFLGMTFYIVPNSDFYVKTDATYQKDGNTYPIWSDIRETFGFDQASFAKEHGVEVKIAGIIRPNPDAMSTSLMAGTIALKPCGRHSVKELSLMTRRII